MFFIESHDASFVLSAGSRRLRIAFVTDAIVRLTYTDRRPFQDRPSLIVVPQQSTVACTVQETAEAYILSTQALKLVVCKQSAAIRYYDREDTLVMREPDRGGKELIRKDIYKQVHAQEVQGAVGHSVDGVRTAVSDSEQVFDRQAFEAKLEFVFSENEALFGLGSHEEGYGNLRGTSRELYQQNMKAVVPYFVSTNGYGVLLDCGSLMTFHDDAQGSYLWADVVDELDYYFIYGPAFDDVTRNYHVLTGRAPLLPKWAFGYMQSKERYVNAQEMVDVVREYRRRQIPLDLIVLDWKSWPNGDGWGQKSFDPLRFPDPQAFTEELHQLGARLMVSIWPIMTGTCPNRLELLGRGLMLGNQTTYNAFQEAARHCYWEQAERGLFAHGVDAWWCDCTEPFEADWQGAVKPEPLQRLQLNTQAAKRYLDAGAINVYSLQHSQGIYEGQRKTASGKRVMNLTRSSYAGQHRYATVTWSGDVSATWETLRRSIPEGLHFCAAGEPYWTVDIGGFFIKCDTAFWFWHGDYDAGCRGLTAADALEPDPLDTGCTDLGYWELYTRWLQYGAFLPIMRSHGTDAPREIWRFGEAGTPFYDAIAKYIRLRYQLIPYIYSLAAQVTLNSYTLMRAVALDFPHDVATHSLDGQYLFGSAFMVCPVTSPMYYQRNSEALNSVPKSREVYLPAGRGWYDFWTEQAYTGGQTITTAAPLEILPLFVPAGSILPLSPVMQHVDEIPDAPYEIRIYRGADALFYLYEDNGDGYAYEHGDFSIVTLRWDDAQAQLHISARAGQFAGQVQARDYQLVFISPQGRETRNLRYTGSEAMMAISDKSNPNQ